MSLKTFVLCVIFFNSVFLFGQVNSLNNNYRLLALGDSYTIGTSVNSNERWPSQLVDTLNTRGIVNDELIYIAMSGWRTDQLLNGVNTANLSADFDLVTLLIGVNNQFQGRSITTYKSEFRALVYKAIELANNSKDKVLILSIPDYAYTPYGQSSSNPNLISQEIDSFNSVNRFISDSLEITYIDITGISRMGIANPALVASDGLHPSGLQYSLWINKILSTTLGFNEMQKMNERVKIYPNPSNGYFEIEGDVYSLCLIGTRGNILKKIIGNKINVELPDGVYFIELEWKDGSRSYEKRIIIN